jgi:hypothetical protein
MMLTSKDRFKMALPTYALRFALVVAGLILTAYAAVLVAGWAN